MSQLGNLGKYHLLERLAADDIAEVYKVKTIGIAGFEKVQVLKRILPHCAQDPKFIRSFIDQAKIAFSLNHRNIVQVFEFGKVDGDLFLAMEYIPGANLHVMMQECLRQQRTPPVGLTCYLMGEVAAGLEYAHRKSDHLGQELGIVHCDINPRNIACSFEGSVKILDFGISRAVWSMIPYQQRGSWLPQYMSPEQVQAQELDPRSDLFAFGTILWELLTGAPLFAAPTMEGTIHSILHRPVPSPRSLNPDATSHLEDLTMHCLVRDREQRIASASELQMELHRIQRMLGAVIGSRALSAFTADLLPGYSETRDVRQEGDHRPAALPDEQILPTRTDDLVDAAAELAEPHNPPADPVRDSRVRARPAEPPVSDEHLAPLLEPADEAPISRLASREAEMAGALRPAHTGRDEVGSPRRPRSDQLRARQLMTTPSAISAISSDEVTAGPVMLPPRVAAPPARTAPEHPAGAELQDLSLSDALEVDDDDTETDPAGGFDGRAHDGELVISGEELAVDEAPGAYVEEPSTVRPPRSRPRTPAPALGEKKRFWAATALLEGDPEQTEDAEALVADIAYKLDGILHDQEPGRLVVLFGLPAADEHDAVSTIRFAIESQDAVGHMRAAPGAERSIPRESQVQLRIGVRTGTARMGGHPSEEGYQLLGNTLAECLALARATPPGQTCLAGLAARLASEHFVLREGRALRRHGKPVRTYRVLAPRTRTSRGGGSAEFALPLVGRDVELRTLRSTWRETVLQGAQRALLVVGEAGTGKSRLVDEFLARHTTDARVIAATGMPHRRDTPYALFADLLRGITGIRNMRGPMSRTRMLQSLNQLLANGDAQQMEALETLIARREGPAEEGRGFSSLGVARAIRGVLDGLAASRPLAVVMEDLNWADSASLDCLATLLAQPAASPGPTLFLLTCRPQDGAAVEEMFGEAASLLVLEELDEDDRARLIRQELGEQATDTVVRDVGRRAGGNPFYVRELARAMQELNIKGVGDVPPTVQGVVAGRVDQLPGAVKSLLQHAAVIGPTFAEAILAKLIGRNPARALAELRNRGIIVPGLRTAVPDTSTSGRSEQFEREWAFRHVLVQEVVYDSITPVDRRELHGVVGEIMARRVDRGSNDPPAEVARHLELGGRGKEAGTFYLRAASSAAAAFAGQEALALYDRALAQSEGELELQYAVHAGRERVYAQLGMTDRQGRELEALRRFCGDDPARRADLLNREALHLLRIGEFYRALSTAEQAESSATEAGLETTRGESLLRRGEAYDRLNDHGRAVEAVTKALEVFREQDSPHNQVRALVALGRIYLVQARYDEAFQQYTPALDLADEIADRWQERVVRNGLAVVHYCRGDHERALDEALYSLRLCEQFGDRAREGDNATVVGIVHLALGLYDHARRYLEAALAIHRETCSPWAQADTLVYLGLLEAASRRFRRAFRCLDQAKVIAERMGATYILVNARNAMAWALCERDKGTTGDAARAVDEATEAAETARAARLVVGEIPGLSRSARATAQLGNLDAARALSRRAVELLEEQRIIDTSEEEVYYTHFRILSTMEDPGALEYLDRAHSGLLSKLERLEHEEHRTAFTSGVRLHAAIIRDFRGE